MSINYEIKKAENRFWVGFEDDFGEWCDADTNGFDTEDEAEAFCEEIQTEQSARAEVDWL